MAAPTEVQYENDCALPFSVVPILSALKSLLKSDFYKNSQNDDTMVTFFKALLSLFFWPDTTGVSFSVDFETNYPLSISPIISNAVETFSEPQLQDLQKQYADSQTIRDSFETFVDNFSEWFKHASGNEKDTSHCVVGYIQLFFALVRLTLLLDKKTVINDELNSYTFGGLMLDLVKLVPYVFDMHGEQFILGKLYRLLFNPNKNYHMRALNVAAFNEFSSVVKNILQRRSETKIEYVNERKFPIFSVGRYSELSASTNGDYFNRLAAVVYPWTITKEDMKWYPTRYVETCCFLNINPFGAYSLQSFIWIYYVAKDVALTLFEGRIRKRDDSDDSGDDKELEQKTRFDQLKLQIETAVQQHREVQQLNVHKTSMSKKVKSVYGEPSVRKPQLDSVKNQVFGSGPTSKILWPSEDAVVKHFLKAKEAIDAWDSSNECFFLDEDTWTLSEEPAKLRLGLKRGVGRVFQICWVIMFYVARVSKQFPTFVEPARLPGVKMRLNAHMEVMGSGDMLMPQTPRAASEETDADVQEISNDSSSEDNDSDSNVPNDGSVKQTAREDMEELFFPIDDITQEMLPSRFRNATAEQLADVGFLLGYDTDSDSYKETERAWGLGYRQQNPDNIADDNNKLSTDDADAMSVDSDYRNQPGLGINTTFPQQYLGSLGYGVGALLLPESIAGLDFTGISFFFDEINWLFRTSTLHSGTVVEKQLGNATRVFGRYLEKTAISYETNKNGRNRKISVYGILFNGGATFSFDYILSLDYQMRDVGNDGFVRRGFERAPNLVSYESPLFAIVTFGDFVNLYSIFYAAARSMAKTMKNFKLGPDSFALVWLLSTYPLKVQQKEHHIKIALAMENICARGEFVGEEFRRELNKVVNLLYNGAVDIVFDPNIASSTLSSISVDIARDVESYFTTLSEERRRERLENMANEEERKLQNMWNEALQKLVTLYNPKIYGDFLEWKSTFSNLLPLDTLIKSKEYTNFLNVGESWARMVQLFVRTQDSDDFKGIETLRKAANVQNWDADVNLLEKYDIWRDFKVMVFNYVLRKYE